MASFINRSSSWMLWYDEQLKLNNGPFHELAFGELSELDDVPPSYAGDSRAFSSTIATVDEDLVFLMIPAAGKRVSILHQCFSHSEKPGREASVIGLCGPDSHAQFKEIPVKAAALAINLPATTHGTSHPRVPTMDQFLEVRDAGEFASLEGEDSGKEVGEIEKLPNSWWLHPAFFLILQGTRGGRAAEVAIKILEGMDGWFEGNDDADELKLGAACTLEFLWAVEKGFTTAVTFGDLGGSPGLDSKCRKILSKIFKESTSGDSNPRVRQLVRTYRS